MYECMLVPEDIVSHMIIGYVQEYLLWFWLVGTPQCLRGRHILDKPQLVLL